MSTAVQTVKQLNYSHVNNEELPKLTVTDERLIDTYVGLCEREDGLKKRLLAECNSAGFIQVHNRQREIKQTVEEKKRVARLFKKIVGFEIKVFLDV